MCGIWAVLDSDKNDSVKYFDQFMKLKHRGPDRFRFERLGDVHVGFHRLAMIDLSTASDQPFVVMHDGFVHVLLCNGEIYNYKELGYETSDCMVVLDYFMTDRNPADINDANIRGEFAFIYMRFKQEDMQLVKCQVGRDHVGVRPLYMGRHRNSWIFSSEIKGLSDIATEVRRVPPGTVLDINGSEYTEIPYTDIYDVQETSTVPDLKGILFKAVEDRLNSDRPIGCLLSGGLDSSGVSAIAQLLSGNVMTFCCGDEDSPDLQHARIAAKHIGSNHTEVPFDVEEALSLIPLIVQIIESWDTTTIRASVPMFMAVRAAAKAGCKALLVGEGPDEICGSYLFNYYAPNDEEFALACKDYTRNLCNYDIIRLDKIVAYFGLEARTPYLDGRFIRAYFSIKASDRRPSSERMEKYELRKALADLLPPSVAWRKKEALSDGIKSKKKSWFEIIQEHVVGLGFPDEKTYYMHLYQKHYNETSVIPGYWQPRWDQNGDTRQRGYVDPSARILTVYS
jgi:asparagine synthase (glutamine-hydrolysing)